METLLRYKLPAVIVLFNNSSWGGKSIAQDLFYWKMGSWGNLPGIRYDRMFEELGCHTEFVENPEDVIPALERSFNSGQPSLVHVVGDATELHPVRFRLNLVDVWTRGDINELPDEAVAMLRQASPKELLRVEKIWRDSGLHVPIEELAEITDVSMEEVMKYQKEFI